MEKIILDLFGGDNLNDVLTDGAYRASSVCPDLSITFAGPFKAAGSSLNILLNSLGC